MTTTTVPFTGAVPVAPDDTATLFDLWGRISNADVELLVPEVEQFVEAHSGLYDMAAMVADSRTGVRAASGVSRLGSSS